MPIYITNLGDVKISEQEASILEDLVSINVLQISGELADSVRAKANAIVDACERFAKYKYALRCRHD